MSRGLIITLSVVGVLALGAISCVSGAFSYRTTCLNFETRIQTQYKQDQNSYDQFWKTVKEMAQVPAMYTDDLKKVYDAAIQGRYGAGGSRAVVQFITEHNPTLDPGIYRRIQDAIESGRNRFASDQQQLLDVKNQYQEYRNTTSALVYNSFLHFPRIDLTKYDIVTSAQTAEAFRTKQADEIKLR